MLKKFYLGLISGEITMGPTGWEGNMKKMFFGPKKSHPGPLLQ